VKADSLKDEESKRFVRKTRSIDEYFTLSPNDSDSGILELVRGLLKLDPDRRLTAKEALQQHFFSSSLPEENHYSS
jgi:serine/threonine protein kinase